MHCSGKESKCQCSYCVIVPRTWPGVVQDAALDVKTGHIQGRIPRPLGTDKTEVPISSLHHCFRQKKRPIREQTNNNPAPKKFKLKASFTSLFMILKTGNFVLTNGPDLLSELQLSVASAMISMRPDSLVIPAGGLQVAGLHHHVVNSVQRSREYPESNKEINHVKITTSLDQSMESLYIEL